MKVMEMRTIILIIKKILKMMSNNNKRFKINPNNKRTKFPIPTTLVRYTQLELINLIVIVR